MFYRWLLRFYPHDFRRQYQDELEADFEALCADARESGRRMALVGCYVYALGDLAISIPREWLRTPWLAAVSAAALVASGVFYYVVIRVYRAGSFAGGSAPPQSPELLWLMAAMVLVPLVAMLLIGIAMRFSAGKPVARRRRV